MSSKDVEMTGVAAATSHLRDTQQPDPKARAWDGDTAHQLMDMLSGPTLEPTKTPLSNRRFTMMASRETVDLEAPSLPETEGVDQFKATFDQVKAELAAGNWTAEPLTAEPLSCGESLTSSPVSISGQSPGLPSRSEIIRSKVRELDSRISATQSQLDSHLRFARNIAVLTPFQKSTRDRLEAVVRVVAKKVTRVRLDMTRLVCHREVLSYDLVAARNDLYRAKTMALKAATQSLQGQEECKIPHMTLSFHDNDGDSSLPQSIPLTRQSSYGRESTCESFHSALDFGPDWPSCSDDLVSATFLRATHFEPATRSSSSVSLPFIESDTGPSTSIKAPTLLAVFEDTGHWSEVASSPRDSGEHGSHEKFYTAQEAQEEQAEEWNKTRAAQRVSLVRLPSGFQMSKVFEKHSQVSRKATP